MLTLGGKMQESALNFRTKQDLHLTRKLFHFLGVMVMVALLVFFSEETCWLLYFGLGGSFIAIDLIRQKSKSLNKFAFKAFGPVLRKSEAHKLSGLTFLVLGTGLTFFIFDKKVLMLSLLFLGMGDPLASLIGVKYGRTKIFGSKSLEGSIAAFAICTLAAFCYFRYFNLMGDHIFLLSFIAGCAGTLSELFPLFKLDDNFTQPVLNGAFLTLIFFYFGGL